MPSRTLFLLLAIFAPLSFTTIGGGQSIVSEIHRQAVTQQGWLTEQQFITDFALSRLAPGPGSLLVTLIGWQIGGWLGAIVASVAIFLPSSVLLYGIARVWARYRGAPWQRGDRARHGADRRRADPRGGADAGGGGQRRLDRLGRRLRLHPASHDDPRLALPSARRRRSHLPRDNVTTPRAFRPSDPSGATWVATKKLEAYRAKRDFTQTSEPSGETAPDPTSRLRFVIQKHAATRLHYDLRLELDGVFKSWAVTKGPSLDPHDRRLAVEVEDHPLDYGDFEGTIPKGQYGGGTVQLWDRGYWAPEGMTPEAGLAKGDLKFQLEGEKLHGSWVLVRIKNDRSGGKRTNWLLIKHRDQWATRGQRRCRRSPRTARSPPAAAWTRSRPARAARRSRSWPSPLPPPARPRCGTATPASPPRPAPPSRKPAESKPRCPSSSSRSSRNRSIARRPARAGRTRSSSTATACSCESKRGKASLRTRKGSRLDREVPQPSPRPRATCRPAIIDGEVVALDDHGAPDFAALQAALSEGKTDRLVYFAFDLLHTADEDLRPLPLRDRKQRLQALLTGYPATLIRFVDHFETGGDAVLQSACRMSLEGIVSKRLDDALSQPAAPIAGPKPSAAPGTKS